MCSEQAEMPKSGKVGNKNYIKSIAAYLRTSIKAGWNKHERRLGTSAMLLTNPSTFVSTVASPGNVCSTSRKSESPPSSRNTSHVVGDSSVTRPSSLNTTHTNFILFNILNKALYKRIYA